VPVEEEEEEEEEEKEEKEDEEEKEEGKEEEEEEDYCDIQHSLETLSSISISNYKYFTKRLLSLFL
jgi:hypothetical protein